MTMTGREALDRSQASAEAEAGVVNFPVLPCQSWIGLSATYDDPWNTPVTNCPVRIMVAGALAADGPRTKSLSAFGKQDGQPHTDVRAELGTYLQKAVQPGVADLALVPSGSASEASDIEKQIVSTLTAFESSMRSILKPWLSEWAAKGWKSIPLAYRKGAVNGLAEWWKGEVDFWGSLGEVVGDVWDGITSGMEMAARWYDNLYWYEKNSLGILVAIGRTAKNWAEEQWYKVSELWDRRVQLMNMFKAFLNGSAAAIEHALEVLVDLPGELGEVIKALVKDSADWVQNMIEVARETDVFKRAAKTLMSVLLMMTPNFWAEGIGMIEGYVLPEVLITIILLIIGALCSAAGAPVLAARVAGMTSKLRMAIQAAGKTGAVLTTLFGKVDELAGLIGKLSKALRQRVEEVHKGATGRVNRLVRRAFYEKWPNAKASKILKELEELNKNKPADAATIQRKKVLSEELGNEAAKNHLRNHLGRDIPDGDFKTFSGPHTVNLYYKDASTGKVYVMEAKGGNSQLGERIGRHGDLKGLKLKQGTPSYLEDVAKQMTVNGAKDPDKIAAGRDILSAMRKDNYEYIIVRGAYDSNAPLGNPILPQVVTPRR
jgi:hypothetical protein